MKPLASNVPNQNLPDFPYMWANNSFWFNKENYIGVALLDENFNRSPHMMNKFYGMDENPLLVPNIPDDVSYAGPEDPRLFFRGGRVILQYNRAILKTSYLYWETKCHSFYLDKCTAIFETTIDCSEGLVFGLVFGLSKMLCKKIIGQPKDVDIFVNYRNSIVKNFSPFNNTRVVVDSYDNTSVGYEIPNENIETCMKYPLADKMVKNDTVNINGSHLALTTPSIRVGDRYYGVFHLRIQQKILIEHFDEFSEDMKDAYSKDDIRCGSPDWYFMMMYKTSSPRLDDLETSVPFIFMGPPDDEKFISYCVNFPCGIEHHVGNIFSLYFGVGDCLFFKANVGAQFDRRLKTFEDLRCLSLNRDEYLNRKIITQKCLAMVPDGFGIFLPKLYIIIVHQVCAQHVYQMAMYEMRGDGCIHHVGCKTNVVFGHDETQIMRTIMGGEKVLRETLREPHWYLNACYIMCKRDENKDDDKIFTELDKRKKISVSGCSFSTNYCTTMEDSVSRAMSQFVTDIKNGKIA